MLQHAGAAIASNRDMHLEESGTFWISPPSRDWILPPATVFLQHFIPPSSPTTRVPSNLAVAPSDIIMGGTPAGDAAVGSDAPRQKSLATADTVIKGCIAWVEKNGQPRRAEILSIRDMKSGVRQFYCNFDNFNKRLDEWVPSDRVDFSREVEWPNPEKEKPKKETKKAPPVAKKTVPKKGQKRPSNKRDNSVISEATTPHPWTGMCTLPVSS